MSSELKPHNSATANSAQGADRSAEKAPQRLGAVWLRLAVFVTPLLLAVCLPVYLIDPYALFSKRSVVADGLRMQTAAHVNQVLLAIIAFARDPAPNILLGDSQMALFGAAEVEAVAHQQYSNLAYGGGTLAEAVSTFWYAARTVRLQSVHFGVSYYSFTDSSRNRVGGAEAIVNSPLSYFFSGDVLEATWADAAAQFLRQPLRYQPTADQATFWQQQLAQLARRKQTYPASVQTLAQLRAIVRYCQEHGIEIAFVIPAQHEDVRRRILELGMNEQYAAFKAAVVALGPTYDCDISNAVTRDRANFRDPFHATRSALTLMIGSIWSDQHDLCEFHAGATRAAGSATQARIAPGGARAGAGGRATEEGPTDPDDYGS